MTKTSEEMTPEEKVEKAKQDDFEDKLLGYGCVGCSGLVLLVILLFLIKLTRWALF